MGCSILLWSLDGIFVLMKIVVRLIHSCRKRNRPHFLLKFRTIFTVTDFNCKPQPLSYLFLILRFNFRWIQSTTFNKTNEFVIPENFHLLAQPFDLKFMNWITWGHLSNQYGKWSNTTRVCLKISVDIKFWFLQWSKITI